MKVHAVREPVRQVTLVYVETAGPDEDPGRYFLDADRRRVYVAPGGEPPIYMEVLDEIAESIAEALAPRPAATERHLDDALALRDRMVGLVERIVDADMAREAKSR